MRFLCLCFALVGLLFPRPAGAEDPAVRADSGPRYRLLVPAYFYPGGEGLRHWERLVRAAARVPLTVVVNPASGPGRQADASYRRVIRRLHRRAVLLGYVATGYGKRPPEAIRRDIDRWLEFYPGLRGFFFDEQSREAEDLNAYALAANYARARLPGAVLVANPGTTFAPQYAQWRTADVYCIYEGNRFPAYLAQPRWTHLAGGCSPLVLWHGVPEFRQARELLARASLPRGCYLYLTDATGANPWERLPRYWEHLVELAETHSR